MPDLSGNLLLDWLPAAARRACVESSERVEVRLEQIVAQGDRGRFAFFPANAVCSPLHQRPLRDALFLYAGFALNVVGCSVACNSHLACECYEATRCHRQLLPWVQR